MITFRKCEISDLDQLVGLLSQLGYPDLDRSQIKITWQQISLNQWQGIQIVENESKEVIGFFSYSLRPQLRHAGLLMSVDELAVAKHVRGLGVGRQIVKEIENIAKKSGAVLVELSTNRDRESYKRGFYIKNGFEEKNSVFMRMKPS